MSNNDKIKTIANFTISSITTIAKNAKHITYDTYQTSKLTEKIIETNFQKYNQGFGALEQFKNIMEDVLIELSKKQNYIKDVQIPKLVRLYEYSQEIYKNNKSLDNILSYSNKYTTQASKIVLKNTNKNIITGLATGTIVAGATTSAISLLGTASTGTAIASLHGTAAINATLAALGGGSIASGGAGIAGGIIVLGGLFVLPSIIAGAFVWSKTTEHKYQEALEYQAKVEEFLKNKTTTINNWKTAYHILQKDIFITNNLSKLLNTLINIFESNIILNKNYDDIRNLCEIAYKYTKLLLELKIVINKNTFNNNLDKNLNDISNKIQFIQLKLGTIIEMQHMWSLIDKTNKNTQLELLKNEEIRIKFLNVFQEATKSIYIISPWIENWVLKPSFLQYFQQAIARNVHIYVVCGFKDNYKYNKRESKNFVTIKNALKLQEILGSKYFHINSNDNTHAKIIICDDKYSISGSFNFLSFQGIYNEYTRSEEAICSYNKDLIYQIKQQFFNVQFQ